MGFSRFFIDRPIFAAVLSIVITIVGLVAMVSLPIAQYPDIVPPTIEVTANYPGANAEVVAETVATPIEQEVNGVERMIYMQSQSASDGSMTLRVTFGLGADLDFAQVLTQNRVSIAEAKLPEDVKRIGVTTKKKSPSLLMCVNILSPDNSRDQLYLSNYAFLQIKDELYRVPGIGDVVIFGARDYSMRVWLDPDKMAQLALSAQDVINAIRSQNVQVAAGRIGSPPHPPTQELQLVISVKGRLTEPKEFSDMVLKVGAEGQIVRLRDVARIELGAKDYNMGSLLDGKECVTIATYQLPDANALGVAEGIRARMEELKKNFPPGVEYQIVYDTTLFVAESIHEVQKTFFEAVALVILVVLVFLQNWRSTIIPILAVPVSIIGTFAVMAMFGFSLNNISLFGLILAIGIVVDDAIVVVENVERNMAMGLSPKEATRKAMDEVGGALVAIAAVLSAVFIPAAFVSGITGQFFKQFALTIAVATIISAFNSLTLSPAMCALMLRSHHDKPDIGGRILNLFLGWFFKLFNKTFDAGTNLYAGAVGRLVRVSAIVMLVYGGLLFLTGFGFTRVPAGFVPEQDKGYLIVNAQLPDGAALARTEKVARELIGIVAGTEGVKHTLTWVGFSMISSVNQANVVSVIAVLEEMGHRKDSRVIAAEMQERLRAIPEAGISVFGPPPVDGLGSAGGLKVMVQDRGSLGFDKLQGFTTEMMREGMGSGNYQVMFSSFRANVPQIYVDIDREQAQKQNVPLTEIFTALQTYLGSYYANDFNFLGRTFQVNVQADAPFRLRKEDIGRLQVRNADGQMVPLSALIKVSEVPRPERVIRYNMFPSADVNIVPKPGTSSGTTIKDIEALAAKTLPPAQSGLSWTDIAFQQIIAGNTMVYIFPFCILLVFLFLAAQYESWSLPAAIVMILPMCILCAIIGVAAAKLDINIFVQIGFVVLAGLAAKNAILIVEFARDLQNQGKDRITATVEAARLRLRPILMTSFAFILGCLPLVAGRGAGWEMRFSLGIAVVAGMVGVTVFGVFLTPVFYSVIRKLFPPKAAQAAPAPAAH